MRPRQRVIVVTGLASNVKKSSQPEIKEIRDDQERCSQCDSIVPLNINGSLKKHNMGKGINKIPCPNTTPIRYFGG